VDILKNIDQTYDTAQTKIKLLVTESERNQAKLQETIEFLGKSMQQLESEKNLLMSEKTQREVEIEDVMREIKKSDEEKSSLMHLK
jgi:predicted nuclease with TOPRIM domain